MKRGNFDPWNDNMSDDFGSTGDSDWDNPFMDHSRPSIPSADWTIFGGSNGGRDDPFATNDRIRANMEDMQQFASGDSGFNPYDHGYDWDEISDAENDGYFD